MKGRDITKQILLAQELVLVLDRLARGGHVIIKLDIAKAFDRVCWCYLRQLLPKMGFNSWLVGILLNNLLTTRLFGFNKWQAGGLFSSVTRG